jgi:CO/xanthine dehydrogenase Mo-binding subunit
MPEPGSGSGWNNPLTDRFDLSSPGLVVLKTGKVEFGQGILLALRQIAAEELDLTVDAVVTVSGDTSASPFEGGTVGSMSVETSGREVRDAAAVLRSELFDAAARKLGVSLSEITAEAGQFLVADRRSKETFWSLAAEIALDRPLWRCAVPKSPKLYKTVGTNIPQTHLLERLGGGAFIHDLSFDGMLHGRVLRKPHPDARLESVEPDAIRGPGVLAVVRERDFIGVVAESEQALTTSMARLERRCRWNGIPNDGPQTPLDLLANAEVTERVLRADQGLSGPKPAEDGQTLSAVYGKPLIGHGSIGPSCGLATVSCSGVEVWSHSQNVFALRDQIARVHGRPAQDVIVRHRLGAGCYGHNGADDAAMDAALLARAVPGRPVRVQWTRQDELRCEPLGSPMRISISARVRDGRIAEWKLTTRSGTHMQRPGWGEQVNLLGPAAANAEFATAAHMDLPDHSGGSKNAVALYDFPQHVTYEFAADLPCRLSALRSLGAFGNVFAIESFIDELAELAGCDPLEFRLRHLADPRARRVVSRVAEISDYAKPCEAGLGRGLGFARFKNTASYCAVVALVSVDETVELRKLWAAVDAGLVINPAGVISQVEGGMLQAASWVLKEAVPTDGTRLIAESWKDYPVLSFAETPETMVEIIADPDFPSSGVGEVSLGPTAGAIANAVANAFGMRMRELPLTRERQMKAALEAH